MFYLLKGELGFGNSFYGSVLRLKALGCSRVKASTLTAAGGLGFRV